MRKENKKIILATIGTIFAIANIQAFAGDEVNTSETITTSVVSNYDTSFMLKGKIDGYKVLLNWKSFSDETLLGYKIVLVNAKGEEKTYSVEKDKTSFESYDAKTGKNKFIIYAMGDNTELKKSNEVYLNMGPNGGIDFSNMEIDQSGMRKEFRDEKSNLKEEYKKEQTENKQEFKEYIGKVKEDRMQEVGDMKINLDELKKNLNLDETQIIKLKDIYINLENDLKYLREHITVDNIEIIKAKSVELKSTYLAKLQEISTNSSLSDILNTRFDIFNKNQFETRAKVQEVKQESKDKKETVKQTYVKAKQDLVSKYKEKFEKAYKEKLSTLSEDKLNTILTKITAKKEQIQANTSLTETKKTSAINQLDALISMIQDILDEKTNGINLDELLN